MIQCVLFNLDGTLLPMQRDEFWQEYLKTFGAWVATAVDPAKFRRQLSASLREIQKGHDPRQTNEQAFYADFFAALGVNRTDLLPRMDDYYKKGGFAAVRRVTHPDREARRAVLSVYAYGVPVGLASNPLLPRGAAMERLRWAELDDIPFQTIPGNENYHFCKPDPRYFQEVADAMKIAPENCLMVGSSITEDLPAAQIGMKTCFVIDDWTNPDSIDAAADYIVQRRQLPDVLKQIVADRPR